MRESVGVRGFMNTSLYFTFGSLKIAPGNFVNLF